MQFHCRHLLRTLVQRDHHIDTTPNTDHQNYVVVGKDQTRNALLIAFEDPKAPGLYASRCEITNLSFVGPPIFTDWEFEAKVP